MVKKLLLCSAIAVTSFASHAMEDGAQTLTNCGLKVTRRVVKDTVISPIANTVAEPLGKGLGIILEKTGDAFLRPMPTAPDLVGAAFTTTVLTTGAILKTTGMILSGDNPVSDFARNGVVIGALNKGVDKIQYHTIGLPKGPTLVANNLDDAALNSLCKTGLGVVEGKVIKGAMVAAYTGGTTSAALAVPAVIATVGAVHQLKQDLPGIVKDTGFAVYNNVSSAHKNIKQYVSDFDNSDNSDDIDIFSNPDAAVLGIGTMIEGSKAVITTTSNLLLGGAKVAGSALTGAGKSLFSVGQWGLGKIFG